MYSYMTFCTSRSKWFENVLTHMVLSLTPILGSHMMIGCWLSRDPEAISPFCGCQSTHLTSAPWPVWHFLYSSTWKLTLSFRDVILVLIRWKVKTIAVGTCTWGSRRERKFRGWVVVHVPASQKIKYDYIPRRIRSSWQRRKSQTRTVPSSEQVANLASVGQKLFWKKTQPDPPHITARGFIEYMQVQTMNMYTDMN